MISTTAPERANLSAQQWRVLILLVISVFINYIDRSNLSVAGPMVKNELGLTATQLGMLFSAFFWTYAGFQLFGFTGWLVDALDVSVVFALAFFLWSGATAATGAVAGFGILYVLRLFLGFGEAVAYPAYSKILAVHFPEHHRGLANALIDAGSKMGPAIGTFIGGFLMARYGWRMFFIVLGLGSLAWLLPWFAWAPRETRKAAAVHTQPSPSVLRLLRERSCWGCCIGLFCANYYWYFLLTWLPGYLVIERGYSSQRMATIGALAYLAIGASAVVNGWLSDRWIAAGSTPTKVRKTFTGVGLLFATIILPVAAVKDETIAITLLMLACVAFGSFTSNHWAIAQTLSGPTAAGKWTGLQNGVGNLAGVVSPWLTGIVKDATGSFFVAFLMTALVALTGAFIYVFVIGRVTEICWEDRPAA